MDIDVKRLKLLQINALEILINSIMDEIGDKLNEWCCKPEKLKNLTKEYLDYSSYFMAFEYAKVVLENRIMYDKEIKT